MDKRKFLLAVSLAVMVLVIAILFQPRIAEHVSVHDVLLGILGFLLLVFGFTRLQRAKATPRFEQSTDTPERVIQVDAPGGDVDKQLASFDRPKKEYEMTLHSLEDRLRRATIDVIRRERACTEEEANEILLKGEWTDDPIGAGYFATEMEDIESQSWYERLRLEVVPDRVLRDRLSATMVALAVKVGFEPELEES